MQVTRKPVPITRKNGGYIVPNCRGVTLGLVGGGTHNGALWVSVGCGRKKGICVVQMS